MNRLLFPRGFAFAVDDLGWNEGSDMSEEIITGPHRAGVKRRFDLRDYKHIVKVGEKVGARVQCLFVLGEMDRENILALYPTTTYQRERWNNSSRVSEEQQVIMNYVRDQAAYMEFGLHGTGHEYWEEGQPQKRAEWYNLRDRKPWPEQSLREHLQCFAHIMGQYGLTRENGHSLPESFVPCAYSYYWNPQGDYSLGKLLTEFGVKYANTDFTQIPELNPPSEVNGGGFDYGTHVINRLNYGNLWYELATLPRTPLQEQQTDVIESHWPNWLAQDDFLQDEVTEAWINYYKSAQRLPDRYIAKNTEQLHSQWLYRKYCRVEEPNAGTVVIDNTAMPEEPYRYNTLGNMVLKIRLSPGEHVSMATINGNHIAGYYEDEGFGFLYLPPLQQERYQLDYVIGQSMMPVHMYLSGTWNAYSLTADTRELLADIKLYGTQSILIACDKPATVSSLSREIQIKGWKYNEELRRLEILANGRDMQGSRATLRVTF